jgi:uncharacterized protein (TIGR02145 family)
MKKLLAISLIFLFAACGNKQGTKKDGNTSISVPENESQNSNTVQEIKIVNQTWMVKNLDVDHYRNGDPIPQVKDSATWASLTTGAWCYHDNDPANDNIFGKLYNWHAVNDPRGLALKGWHIPTDGEWIKLTYALGGGEDVGGKMKEIGSTLWKSPNTLATNSSGFTGLPGGSRGYDGSFSYVGFSGYWWSSTEDVTLYAGFRSLVYDNGDIIRNAHDKRSGFSVRCIKD